MPATAASHSSFEGGFYLFPSPPHPSLPELRFLLPTRPLNLFHPVQPRREVLRHRVAFLQVQHDVRPTRWDEHGLSLLLEVQAEVQAVGARQEPVEPRLEPRHAHGVLRGTEPPALQPQLCSERAMVLLISITVTIVIGRVVAHLPLIDAPGKHAPELPPADEAHPSAGSQRIDVYPRP